MYGHEILETWQSTRWRRVPDFPAKFLGYLEADTLYIYIYIFVHYRWLYMMWWGTHISIPKCGKVNPPIVLGGCTHMGTAVFYIQQWFGWYCVRLLANQGRWCMILLCLSVCSLLGCKRTVVCSQGPSRFHLAGSKSWFLLSIFAWSDWPWMETSSFLSPDNYETFVWQFRLPSPRSKVETTLCATYLYCILCFMFIYWLIYLFVSVYIHRWNKTTSLVQATQKVLKRENMVKYTPDMADIFRCAVDMFKI